MGRAADPFGRRVRGHARRVCGTYPPTGRLISMWESRTARAPGSDLDALVEEHAWRIGAAVAGIHETPHDPLSDDKIHTASSLPPDDEPDHLSVAAYAGASGAALQQWDLIQRDPALAGALRWLRDAERAAPKVPVHGDLRLDRFVDSGDGLEVTGREHARLGDAARDVGALVGDWLHLAVERAGRVPYTAGGVRRTAPAGLTRTEIAARAAAELARIQPVAGAFWSGYRSVRTQAGPGLVSRSVAFAGRHLFGRTFGAAEDLLLLGAPQHVANGVARSALLTPDDLARLLEPGGRDAVRG